MVNGSITLTKDVWTVVADNVDYLAQNLSVHKIRVKAADSTPTTVEGSFELQPGELIGHTLLSGKVYMMCPYATVAIVVAS